MSVQVHTKLATAVAVMFVAMSIIGAAGAQAATPTPATPPNAPVGSATTYQMNAAHDGLATDAPTSPLYRAWSRNLGGAVSYPLVVNGRVFVVANNPSGGSGTTLWALNAADGSTEWGPLTISSDFDVTGITADGANVYYLTYGGKLVAINQATGAQVWSQQGPTGGTYTSAPIVHNGVLYFVNDGSTVGSGTIALSAATGTLLWVGGAAGAMTLAVTDDGVYSSGGCGVTSRDNISTGQQDWVHTSVCEGGGGTIPVVHNDDVYVADPSYPAVLDAATGAVVGSFTSSATPAFAGNVGYYLQGTTLRAVDTTTNQVLWSQSGDGGLDSAPIVLGSEVAIGSSTGRIYVVNAQTGSVDWSADTGSAITASAPNGLLVTGLAASGGQLFVPASNTLVAYANETPAIAFVQALYQNFLGRSGNSTEMAYWVGLLGSGMASSLVAGNIATSPEAYRHYVAGLYKTILGRSADSAGLQYWTVGLGAMQGPDGVAEALYESSEFFTKAGGSDALWVQALYRDVLRRRASNDEVTYWAGITQDFGRPAVATFIYSSTESTNIMIQNWYQQLLGRPADPGGLAFFQSVFAFYGASAVLFVPNVLAESPEYFAHAKANAATG